MNKEPISRKLLGSQTIKFNSIMIEPLLENETNIQTPNNDDGYKKLMNACIEGFMALRSKLIK